VSVPLKIEVTADVVCPWCWLGWRRLKRALEMSPGVTAQLSWKPYQLNPSMPAEGADYKEYMAAKFPPERMKKAQATLKELGAEDGIEFKFDNIRRAPNTNAAHRLIRWAEKEGKLDAVAEGVMRAYFNEGKFIGDENVLAGIGAAAGMDREKILANFAQGVDIEAVKSDDAGAKDSGVNGVPFYRIGDEIFVEGSYPAEDMAEKITEAVK
jgi:predicted DsbA family dithiol-disulfide isomerase